MKRNTSISYFIFLLVIFFNISQAQWERITLPGSRGGAVTSLCVKDTFLFAGTDAGVYRSSDNGAHWIKVNPFFPPRYYNPWTFTLVANGQYILAGFAESGIYMSSDNGESWEAKLVGDPRTIPSYEIAASGNWIIAGGPLSYYSVQSTDNGSNWTTLQFPLGHIKSAALRDSFALACADSGVFRSTDRGTTWAKVYSEHFSDRVNSPVAFSDSLAFVGINYINGENYNGFLLSSSDSGLTWTPSVFPSCGSINSIVFSPVDTGKNYIFIGTDVGVFRSSNYGETWVLVNDGVILHPIYSLAFKGDGAEKPAVLVAGTGDGLFSSTDYGETWIISGSPSEWIFSSNDHQLFAVSSNGFYNGYSKYTKSFGSGYSFRTTAIHSNENGLNWTEAFAGVLDDSAQISSLCVSEYNSNGFTLYAGGRKVNKETRTGETGFIFTSSEQAVSWTKAYSDIEASNVSILGANSTAVFANVVPKSATSGAASTGGLYRTTDDSNSWTRVDTSLYSFSSLSFNGGKIYVGGSSRGPRGAFMANTIVVSTDNGETWSRIKTPIDTSGIIMNTPSMITSLYATGSHLFVGMATEGFKSLPIPVSLQNVGVLYHLYFNGENWVHHDSAFVGRSIFALAASGTNIFAGTDSGVFRTTDYGATWEEISSGMNRLNVASLFISEGNLFTSTINGLWKRPLSEITSVESNLPEGNIPKRFYLSQNYPNPFNPSTQIEYSIPHNSLVSLKVYDLLGQEVASLFEGVRQPGDYTATFHGRGMASGLYLYRLKAGNFVETKKLILLK